MKRRRVYVGYFDSEEAILDATSAARDAGLAIHDVYTPYAVHGMDEAMGLRRSRLGLVCLFAAVLGLLCAVGLQYYTSVVSWPLNVGGKPAASWPAFVPVTFELTVLFAALITVAALLVRAKLFPGRRAHALPRATNDLFALALETEDAGFDEGAVVGFLASRGALSTELVEAAP